MKKQILLIIIIVAAVIAGAVYFGVQKFSDDPDARNVPVENGVPMVEVKDYRHVKEGEATCMALLPECGYCPGTVVDRKCFVSRSQD